jgi:hypothetical protein
MENTIMHVMDIQRAISIIFYSATTNDNVILNIIISIHTSLTPESKPSPPMLSGDLPDLAV